MVSGMKKVFYRLCPLPVFIALMGVVLDARHGSIGWNWGSVMFFLALGLSGMGIICGFKLLRQAEGKGEKPIRLFLATLVAGLPILLSLVLAMLQAIFPHM